MRLYKCGKWVQNSAKTSAHTACIATAIHCNYDSNIFTTLNYTHLTVGEFKVAKIHKTLYSCFKRQNKQVRV